MELSSAELLALYRAMGPQTVSAAAPAPLPAEQVRTRTVFASEATVRERQSPPAVSGTTAPAQNDTERVSREVELDARRYAK